MKPLKKNTGATSFWLSMSACSCISIVIFSFCISCFRMYFKRSTFYYISGSCSSYYIWKFFSLIKNKSPAVPKSYYWKEYTFCVIFSICNIYRAINKARKKEFWKCFGRRKDKIKYFISNTLLSKTINVFYAKQGVFGKRLHKNFPRKNRKGLFLILLSHFP